MLSELLSIENIKLNVEVSNWQDALWTAGQLLVDANLISEQYIEDMIKSVYFNGPYFVIAPHIVLGHIAPSKDIAMESMSLITLKNAINFYHLKHDPIGVVIVIATNDDLGHLKLISSILEFAGQQDNYYQLIDAKNVEEVLTLIEKY